MNRRRFLVVMASAGAALHCHGIESEPRQKKKLGIGMHSYALQWVAAKSQSQPKFNDPLTFLKYCHGLGAGGIQVAIGARPVEYARELREQTEKFGMYLECQASLPRDESDLDRFETEVKVARAAGATTMRTAMLSGRRYETFDSLAGFQQFAQAAWASAERAEPVLKRHGMRLAIENHKDWFAAEFVAHLKSIGSERIGVCLDLGNNIALLEEPMSVIRLLAPLAFSTHVKDMGIELYPDGFLLSEVPLGSGFLQLKEIISFLQKINPHLQFNLEMMTRDPLKVPCLTARFWRAMPAVPAARLAAALEEARAQQHSGPLPRITGLSQVKQLEMEDYHVKESIRFAAAELGI